MSRIVFYVIFIFHTIAAAGSEIDLESIRRAIEKKGASWTAGETWLTRLPAEQRRMALGLVRESPGERGGRLHKLTPQSGLPARFSWEEFLTPVKDQGLCGSCSYFSTLAAVEAWIMIRSGVELDLSEQYALSCGSFGSCEHGALIQSMHRFVRDVGIPLEECFPYRAMDGISCSQACPEAASQLVRIGDYVILSQGEGTPVELIKNAVYHRPVVVDMEVYSDFMSYTSGVYEYVTGDLEGGHAVLVYGWDDEERAWLCKNSWGTGWGARGHFRIKWGESEIGNTVVMIWEDAEGFPRLEFEPPMLDLTMAPDEALSRHLVIRNSGSGYLEYSARVKEKSIAGEMDMGIELPYGTGVLGAGERVVIPVHVSAPKESFGFFMGEIEVLSNDGGSSQTVPLQIYVQQPLRDVAISSAVEPDFHWPAYMHFSPTVLLRNWGTVRANDPRVNCRIYDESGAELYSHDSAVQAPEGDSSSLAVFPALSLKQPGEYQMQFTLTKGWGDDNGDNDWLTVWFEVVDRIDDFESPSSLWDPGQGWGATDEFTGGYTGVYAMHVNSGRRYDDNMINPLTLRRGFDLSEVSNAALRFWLRYAIQKDRDLLRIQASSDSIEWTTLETITGANLRWSERQVPMTGFAGPGFTDVRVRFLFTSDETGNGIGPMLDDIALAVNVTPQAAGSAEPGSAIESFQLKQNYPNPFNPVTHIRYIIAEPARVQIRIHNLNGQRIAELVNESLPAGDFTALWDGSDHPSGVYLCRMTAVGRMGQARTLTRKMVLVK